MPNLTIDDLDLNPEDLKIELKPEPKLLLSESKPRWHAQAKVLVLEHIHCACGQEFLVPAAKALLVRFVCKNNLDIQELSDHPAVQNPDLPLVRRTMISHVEVCQHCVKELSNES